MCTPERTHAPRRLSGRAGLALWSLLMAIAHGAGMVLTPALMPLCLSVVPEREITAAGAIMFAFAAVGVHTAAMLAITGVMTLVACRSFNSGRFFLNKYRRAESS